MKRSVASVTSASAVALAAVAGSHFGPTPWRPLTAAWYARLRKSPLTPPGPVFGAAWALLDVLLWYAGARLLRQPPRPRRTVALGFWGLSVLGVGGFSWVLFGRKQLGEALGVSGAMVGTSVGLVTAALDVDRKAAVASMPLAAWVAFAFFLQEEVWRKNR